MLVFIRKLSDEYPFARVSVIIQLFCIFFVLAKSAFSSIRVNLSMLKFVTTILGISLSLMLLVANVANTR